MLSKKTLLTASNLNSAFISKSDTNAQSINSNLTVSGGALTLKNSVLTDNANSGYFRIDPQGNNVIIYDGVNNQRLDVYSSSGSESTYFQTINGTTSFGQIDVATAVDHLEINTNTNKRVDFGGKIQILNGADLVMKAGTSSNDAGDLVFQTSGGTELARIYSTSGGTLSLSSGTNTDAQIGITDTAITLNEPTTVAGKITTTSGGIDIQGSANALTFTFGGGGFNMIDSTWIRTTGSKSFYHNTGSFRTDGTLQVGNNGGTLSVPNGGDVTAGKSVIATQFVVSGGVVTDTVNNSPWYGIGRANTLYGTFSGGQTGVQVGGYYGVNLKTQNGELILDPSYSSAPKYNGNPMWHSGNMGAGSNLDADKLDGIQGSSYLRSDTSDTFTGTLTLSGNQTVSGTLGVTGKSTMTDIQATAIGSNESGIYLPFVKGGQYTTTTATVTGSVAVTLPVSWTNTMMQFEVGIYDYSTGESFTTYIAGYNYSSTTTWQNGSAYILNGNKTNRNFTVRFGHDGTKCVVYIGEINSVWSYPQIIVKNFYGGFQGITFDNWNDGWAVGFVTTFGTVTQTITDTYVRASDADTLDGINSSQFLRNDQNGTLSGNIIVTGTTTLQGTTTSSGLLTASSSLSVNGTGTITGSTATPLLLQRGGTSNLNIQFQHTSANAYFGIDNTGNFKVGTVADLNGSGTKIWHEGNDGSGSTLDADTVDGIQGSSFLRSDIDTSLGVNKLTGTAVGYYLTLGNAPILSGLGNIVIQADSDDSSTTEYLSLKAGADDLRVVSNGTITFNSNKVWHAGNDGSGSGLDADTVDGIDSTRIIFGDNATGSMSVGDVDDIYTSGFYQGNNITNAPSTGWYWIMNSAHTSNTPTYKFNGQIAFKNVGSGSPEAYIRTTASNITKTNWGRLWHDQNDGTGSGLDADLIRNQEPFIDRGYATSGSVTSANANNITSRGMYRVYWSGVSNRPTSYDWGNLVVFEGSSSREQVFFADTDSTDGGLYFRQDYDNNGTWNSWRKVWDNFNDGAGSGLDADTVDGIQGSRLVLNDANGSIAGELTVSNLKLGSIGEIRATYNNGHIVKDFNNGHVTLSAAGGHLYLGYQNTTGVRVYSNLYASNGTTLMGDTAGKLYYQGSDTDGRYAKKAGETYTGTHDFTGATLYWARDTDTASISLVDYGADTDWLTVDVGDRDTDIFRVRGSNASGGVVNVVDFSYGGGIQSYVNLDMNNHNVNGVAIINGQFGTIAKSTDEWLRINDDASHTSGIFFGSSIVRTDGTFQVGSGAVFKAESNGNVTLTGDMYMSNNKTIYQKNSAGTNLGVLQVDSSDNMFLGSDSLATTLRGNALTVRPNATFNSNITLTSGSGDRGYGIKGLAVGAIGSFSGWNANALYINTYSNAGTATNTYSNVEIGGNIYTRGTLQIGSVPNVTLSGGGALTIGSTTGASMAFDANEIQARSSGNASVLNLNILGGDIAVGGTIKTSLSNAIAFKATGYKSFVFNNPTSDNLVLAPSTTINAEDWDWTKQFVFGGDGSFTVNGTTNIKNSFTMQLGKTPYYNGALSGGDSIYVDNSFHLGAKNSLTLWSDTGGMVVRTGATGNTTTRFEVQSDGDVLVNGEYVNSYYSNVQPKPNTGWYTVPTSGWYTLAYNGNSMTSGDNGGTRAYAMFTVMDKSSGNHTLVQFTAGCAFNQESGVNLKLLGKVMYGSAETIGGLRILTGTGTYDTQYVEVYLLAGAIVKYVCESNHWEAGWNCISPTIRTSVPTGYTSNKLEMQTGYEGIPRNVTSGTVVPPDQGMFKGDIYIQY